MTKFGRALAELNIEIPCVNSSQVKGRVERSNRTLQNGLVKELPMASIRDMAASNAFLASFVERFNERFSIGAAKADDLHRPLHVTPQKLNDILCHRETVLHRRSANVPLRPQADHPGADGTRQGPASVKLVPR